jgi:hypothetical protein
VLKPSGTTLGKKAHMADARLSLGVEVFIFTFIPSLTSLMFIYLKEADQ